MKTKLSFNANAKLEKLIGRELITNNIIAIFELIKNSYDAFATKSHIRFVDFDISLSDLNNNKNLDRVVTNEKSRIIIFDDGIGMSFDEIKTKWMQIGTTSKEGINEISYQSKKRIINGEKGIGRFGADRLGSVLFLESVDKTGKEKTSLLINWNEFDDYSQSIQDIEFDCNVERLSKKVHSGLSLDISGLRDEWTKNDIIKLKRQLKKLISPYAQEEDVFSIILEYNDEEKEKIVNDSFDYATTGINVALSSEGNMKYEIFTDLEKTNNSIKIEKPAFGPIKLQILYMDKAAKGAFAKRTGLSTKDYGNIKLFRDNFRVLPYGEKENDWLNIDNKHAQGAFRTFGTRDLIGFVQITKEKNPLLKDATNRQGLNEDIAEFELFKSFVWRCIELLQDYVFKKIRDDSYKNGKIIKENVESAKLHIIDLEKDITNVIYRANISEIEKQQIKNKTVTAISSIKTEIKQIENANKLLTTRVSVMEKIVGSENRVYDMLHAVKNRLDSLESIITRICNKAKKLGISIDTDEANAIITSLSKIVMSAMRRTSPKRNNKDIIILSDFIEEFIEENKKIYKDIEFIYEQKEYTRLFINIEGLKICLENLLDNSVKAMKNEKKKRIIIKTYRKDSTLRLIFEDNGIGISKEDAPFIFNVSFSSTGGSGIGLASVLDFMKEEGGDINQIKSTFLKGASFELIFPLKGEQQ